MSPRRRPVRPVRAAGDRPGDGKHASPSQPRAQHGAPASTAESETGEDHDAPLINIGLAELIQRIIAPTTVLAALAYYFGRQFTSARASYFGIDASLLGLTTQDYVVRSADALFVPLGILVFIALVAIEFDFLVQRRIEAESWVRPLTLLSHLLRAVGLVLLAFGIHAVFLEPVFDVHYLPPLSPGVGVLLFSYGSYLHGRLQSESQADGLSTGLATARKFLVGAFVVLSLFWTTSDYAGALGNGRAASLAADLDSRPATVVYSKSRLAISGPGVRVRRVGGSASEYRYRYAGLRLLIRSGGNYFLVPDDWSRSQGTVIVLPEQRNVRFEFAPRGN